MPALCFALQCRCRSRSCVHCLSYALQSTALPMRCTAIDRFACAPVNRTTLRLCFERPCLALPWRGRGLPCRAVVSPFPGSLYLCSNLLISVVPLRCYALQDCAVAMLCFGKHCHCGSLPRSVTPSPISAHQRFAVAMRGPALPCRCRERPGSTTAVLCGTEPLLCLATLNLCVA